MVGLCSRHKVCQGSEKAISITTHANSDSKLTGAQSSQYWWRLDDLTNVYTKNCWLFGLPGFTDRIELRWRRRFLSNNSDTVGSPTFHGGSFWCIIVYVIILNICWLFWRTNSSVGFHQHIADLCFAALYFYYTGSTNGFDLMRPSPTRCEFVTFPGVATGVVD